MRIVHAVIDDEGNVVGTAESAAPAVSGATGAPTARLVARPGQRIVEVRLEGTLSSLEPEELHKAIRAQL